MDRKAVARETMKIMEQGYYELPPKQEKGTDKKAGENREPERMRISIKETMEDSIRRSILISPDQGARILEKYGSSNPLSQPQTRVENISTVDAIRILSGEGKTTIGVLNFASAKNPGGGFLNGAMAQEESLAASSTLYPTLTANETYYRKNRANPSMMYLDYGIYSPDVLFFRDGSFRLTDIPVKASVLTLPAVNMGQVLLKGENQDEARRVMRRRMKLALGIFAEQGAEHLVLGAYGCGVFRNNPSEVAAWWRELLEEGMGVSFASVFHAVLDRSRGQECIEAFQAAFSI